MYRRQPKARALWVNANEQLKPIQLILALSIALVVFSTDAHADAATKLDTAADAGVTGNQSQVFVGQQNLDVDRSSLPPRGMTMTQIYDQYGEATQKIKAVGEPPISRWVYDDYTLYFEHQILLHVVVHPISS